MLSIRRFGVTAFDCALNNKALSSKTISAFKELALCCVDVEVKVCSWSYFLWDFDACRLAQRRGIVLCGRAS